MNIIQELRVGDKFVINIIDPAPPDIPPGNGDPLSWGDLDNLTWGQLEIAA